MSLLLTLDRFIHCSRISIVNFEQVNVRWVVTSLVLSFGTQPTFICSKLTKEALEQGVKYVQS